MSEKPQQPKNSDLFNQRGMELADRGWFNEALREFGRAIEQDPASPSPRINRASVLWEQGRMQEALEDLLAASRLAPHDPNTHFHLGAFLSQYGSQLAMDELRTSLDMDPGNLDTLLTLANAHSDRGELVQAEVLVRKALESDPSNLFCHHELGALLMEKGMVHEAIAHLREAQRQLPDDVEIQMDLGAAFVQAGFLDQGISILEDKVLPKAPGNFFALYKLATAFVKKKNFDQAKKYLGLAIQHDKTQVQEWLAADKTFDALRQDHDCQHLFPFSAPK